MSLARLFRREYVILLALAAWLIGLLIPYWNYSDWEGRQTVLEENLTVPFQLGGSILFIAFMLAFGTRFLVRYIKLIRYNPHIILLFIYFTLQLLFSAISIAPLESAAYALYSGILVIALGAIWTMDDAVLIRGLRLLTIAFIVYMAAYMLKNLDGQLFGAIQKNQFAKSLQAALLLSVLTFARGRVLVAALLVGIIALMSSRSSLLTSLILIIGISAQFALQGRPAQVNKWVIATLATIVILIPASPIVVEFVYSHVLALDSESRGLDAGLFTGRQYLWKPAVDLLADKPFLGYGFRTREDLSAPVGPEFNAHMGYLNLMLDSGVVGGAFFLYALFFVIVARLIRHRVVNATSIRVFDPVNFRDRLNFLILLFMISYVALLFSEPIYFSLGTPFSLLVILLFAAPVTPSRVYERPNL